MRPRAATPAKRRSRRSPAAPDLSCTRVRKAYNVRRFGRLPRRDTEVREVRSDLRAGARGPDCGSGRSLPAATRACICWRAGSAGWEPPTSAVLVVCTGAYLLRVDRRRCAAFVLGGLPFLVRSPPRIRAERGGGRHCAIEDGFRRPVASSWSESLPGLLFSRARGPGLVLAGVGARLPERGRGVAKPPLPRPDTAVTELGGALMILAAGKWFDWWGGLTWGYRSIVDAAPLLALLMIPIVQRIVASRPLRALCAVLLAWSIAVQFVGAYSYSLTGWSHLWRDYDRPEQASPWRWDRPQIGYHLANFSSERARTKQVMAIYLNYAGPILNVPNRRTHTRCCCPTVRGTIRSARCRTWSSNRGSACCSSCRA